MAVRKTTQGERAFCFVVSRFSSAQIGYVVGEATVVVLFISFTLESVSSHDQRHLHKLTFNPISFSDHFESRCQSRLRSATRAFAKSWLQSTLVLPPVSPNRQAPAGRAAALKREDWIE
jgi:hypothetical protein